MPVIIVRLTFILLFIFNTASAQPYYFRHFQVENGLSHNTVFCSIQDRNGFMWFGTKDGLNRFDGYNFKTFHINGNEEKNLDRDQVSTLALDSSYNMWVGTQKGLYLYDAEKELLTRYCPTLSNINFLFTDKDGFLWILSSSRIYRFNVEEKKLTVYPHNFHATSICQSNDGRIWFSAADGTLQLLRKNNSFLSYSVFNHSPHASTNWIEKILADENDNIYVGTTGQGVKVFNTLTGSYTDLLTYNPDKTTVYVRNILQVSPNEFWIATEYGIYVYNAATRNMINLRKVYEDPYSLSDNAIYSLVKDNEGGIWAGTYFGGVNYYPDQSGKFKKYFPDNTGKSISGNAVRVIVSDNSGKLWISTEDAGLNRFDPKTGEFRSFLPTGKKDGISNYNIHGLLVVDDNLWIGTFEHGLDIMDIESGKVIRNYSTNHNTRGLQSNFVVSMMMARDKKIYLATTNGLFQYNKATDSFHRNPFYSYNGFTSSIFEDHTGTIWLGTHESGLYYFNPNTGFKGHFENDKDNPNSIPTNTINALYEDIHHDLWIATEGGGLCQLKKDRKTFIRHTNKSGLPSNFVFKVLEDEHNNLWVTTSKGLVKFNPANGFTKVYTKENGLLNDQFNYNSGFRDDSGHLYFGSVKGMISFDPKEQEHLHNLNTVFITGFQVNNEELIANKENPILAKSILYTDKITLPHNKSSFSIDFAAVNFTSPEMVSYSYKMEGLDKEYTTIRNNRKVYFTNLKPGHYTFKVRANNGLQNENERALNIYIKPPVWATWYAFLFYTALVIALVYYLAKTYHDMQENRKKKEIYEAKIDFFTNIAHEIKTPLTLIKGPVENLMEIVEAVPEIREDLVTMERNTQRLVNLINQVLDFRQTETMGFSLDFTPVNVNEVLKDSIELFKALAAKKKLELVYHEPIEDIQTMADAESLQKIFSNLVSNAVKYADKKVEIEFIEPSENDAMLEIRFRNDGFIIPEQLSQKIFEPFFRLKETSRQKGTGIGLALARSLTELNRGQLYLGPSVNGMNSFILKLPYQPEILTERNSYATNNSVSG